MDLQPHVLPPQRARIVRAATYASALAAAGTAGAIAVLLLQQGAAADPAPVILPASPPAIAPAPPPAIAPAPPPAIAPPADDGVPRRPDDFAFVFTAGGARWIRLADVGGDGGAAVPAHGAPRMSEHDGRIAAIAPLAEGAAPAPARGWQGRQVLVDGTCTATVGPLAVIALVVGDPGYAPTPDARWTAAASFEAGHKVLAGRLDRCDGTWARAADRAPAVLPIEVDLPLAAAAARRDLLASTLADETQRAWRDAEMTGSWVDSDAADVTIKVFRHPRTGATWVLAHAHLEGGCGDPYASFIGLYQVGAAGITRVALTELSMLDLDQLIDIDGDGRFELVGSGGLGSDSVLYDDEGAELDRLDIPFYGCPC
jgi:hypothetical protein